MSIEPPEETIRSTRIERLPTKGNIEATIPQTVDEKFCFKLQNTLVDQPKVYWCY
jgi:hypothetical protein